MKLENALSPMIRNRSILADTLEQDDIELIQKIKALKMDVVNDRMDPEKMRLLRPEIVDSWIRSYNYGLNVFEYNYAPTLDEAALEMRCQEKSLLLKASEPFIYQLESMLGDSQCIILLSDERGTMLRVIEGSRRLEDQNARFRLKPGSVWNEETVGTCAHGISLILGVPMQICGPEHYCEKYDDIFCSAAPIFDGNANLAGTLSIVSPSFHQQNAHSLGLVVSMAWATEKEFQLLLNSKLLSVAMDSSGDGVFTINNSGIITNANAHARNFFAPLLEHDFIGMHYGSLLGRQDFIEEVLAEGKPAADRRIFLERWDQRINILSVQPLNEAAGPSGGCIITFKKAERSRKKPGSLPLQYKFNHIIGQSPELDGAVKLAEKFSYLDANVILQGESGTGKEMFAQAIHGKSRPHGPFVAVNCAAIPSALIESELFGYEGGSFTGAERQGRPGKIELADGGTLFLDEIGDMPLDLQPVLLRVLDEKRIMRVGGSQYLPVDFRLITATNKNLTALAETDQFRTDLLYRLKVLEVNIPPLRERGYDIILLANHFLQMIARQQKVEVPVLSDVTTLALLNYAWPGNVRQLENVMLYALNISSEGIILPEHLPPEMQTAIPRKNNRSKKESDSLSLREVERIFIAEALQQNGNNILQTAESLQMSRSTLYRKIKEYGIKTGQ